MTDTTTIRRKMRQKKLTVHQVAESLAMNPSTFYRKLSRGGATFSLDQAQSLARILNLTSQEARDIFFEEDLA